jgi:hypothetical protein
MRKISLLIIALIIFLVVLLSIVFVNAQQIFLKNLNASEKNEKFEKEYDFMWTKALCNDSFCQDYEIYCKRGKVVNQVPITGAILFIDENWEDPRPIEFQELMC